MPIAKAIPSAQNPEDRAGVLPDALSVDQQQCLQRPICPAAKHAKPQRNSKIV
jgi:hypothetical protein